MNPADVEAAPFVREERYIVIKRKHLTPFMETSIRNQLEALAVPTIECAVIESDWPEYETVWKMIERRVVLRTHAPMPGEVGELVERLDNPSRKAVRAELVSAMMQGGQVIRDQAALIQSLQREVEKAVRLIKDAPVGPGRAFWMDCGARAFLMKHGDQA